MDGSALRILGVAMMLSHACLVPPEGEPPTERGHAPEVDPSGLDPPAPIVDVDPGRCATLHAIADRIIDRDDRILRFRWVANNGTPWRAHVTDEEPSEQPIGANHVARVGASPTTHFGARDEGAEGRSVGVLSLFVTDAPAWAISAPRDAPPSVYDFGRLPTTDGAISEHSVVEVRWTFQFSESGGCP